MKSDKLIFKTGCYITSGWRQRYDGTALSTGRGCNLSLMGAVFCPLQPQRVSLPLCPPLLPPILIIPSFIFPLHLLSLSCFFPSYLLHYYIYIFSPFSRSIYLFFYYNPSPKLHFYCPLFPLTITISPRSELPEPKITEPQGKLKCFYSSLSFSDLYLLCVYVYGCKWR